MIIRTTTITLVYCFSVSWVSAEKPAEQRGVRHTEGGRESGGAAAPPRPCRANWAGESAGGGASSAKMFLTALSDKGAHMKAVLF